MKSNSAAPDLRRDVALRTASIDARLALDQLGDDRGIGLDRRRRAGAGRRAARGLVRDAREEVAAVDDRLQRVADERIGSAQTCPGRRPGWPVTPARG